MSDDHRIRTFTGRMVDPFNLTPDDIDIIDIAHALARIPRFNGHTAGFLSVARHSIRVAQTVPQFMPPAADPLAIRMSQFTGLLHDASEAYLCDIPSPVKSRPEMEGYREAEARAHHAIATKFGSLYPHPQEVRHADAFQLEEDLVNRRHDPHHEKQTLQETMFLAMFERLRPGAGEVPK